MVEIVKVYRTRCLCLNYVCGCCNIADSTTLFPVVIPLKSMPSSSGNWQDSSDNRRYLAISSRKTTKPIARKQRMGNTRILTRTKNSLRCARSLKFFSRQSTWGLKSREVDMYISVKSTWSACARKSSDLQIQRRSNYYILWYPFSRGRITKRHDSLFQGALPSPGFGLASLTGV